MCHNNTASTIYSYIIIPMQRFHFMIQLRNIKDIVHSTLPPVPRATEPELTQPSSTFHINKSHNETFPRTPTTERIIKQNILYSRNVSFYEICKMRKTYNEKKTVSFLNPPVYSNPCGLHRSIVETGQCKMNFVVLDIEYSFVCWVSKLVNKMGSSISVCV